jgi:hypothetical protein
MADETLIFKIDIQGTDQQTKELSQLQSELDRVKRSMKELTKVEKTQGALTTQQTAERAKLTTQLHATRNAYNDLQGTILKQNDALRKNSGFVNGVRKGMTDAVATIGSLVVAYRAMNGVINAASKLNKDAIKLFNEERKAAIVFGDSLGYVTSQSRKNAIAIGLTESGYISAAAATQDLLVPLGFARDNAAKFSTELTDLSGALALWDTKGRSAAEVSEILTKALLGEAEQAKSLGIVIDQSSKAYNARIKVLVETEGVTQAQAKAMDILDQITQKTTDAQNNFAESAENMGLKQAQANAKLEQAYELLVQRLTPAMIEFTDMVAGLVDWAFQTDVATEAQKNFAETLNGTRDQALETIKLTRQDIAESEFWIKTYEKREEALFDQLYANKLNDKEFKNAIQSLVKEREERERNLEINKSYIGLVIENEAAILALANAQDKNAESTINQSEKTKGLIESLKQQQKALNESLDAAGSISEIRSIQSELEKVGLQLKYLTNLPEKDKTIDLDVSFDTSDGKSISEAFTGEFENLSRDVGFIADDLMDEYGEKVDNRIYDQLKKEEEAALKTQKEWENAYKTIGLAATDAFGSVIAAQYEQQVARAKQTAEIETQVLKDKLDKGIINETEYTREVEELQREVREKEKQASIAQAVIDGASAVLKGIAQFGPPPSIPGIAAIAAAALTTGAQIAVIESQTFADGGVFDGASHEKGGIKGTLNGKRIEVEGDEMWIANKRAKRSNKIHTAKGTPEEIISGLNGIYGGRNWKQGAKISDAMQVDYTQGGSTIQQIIQAELSDARIVRELSRQRKENNRNSRDLKETLKLKANGYY